MTQAVAHLQRRLGHLRVHFVQATIFHKDILIN